MPNDKKKKHPRANGRVFQRVAAPGWNGETSYIRLDGTDEVGNDFHLFVRAGTPLAGLGKGDKLKIVAE